MLTPQLWMSNDTRQRQRGTLQPSRIFKPRCRAVAQGCEVRAVTGHFITRMSQVHLRGRRSSSSSNSSSSNSSSNNSSSSTTTTAIASIKSAFSLASNPPHLLLPSHPPPPSHLPPPSLRNLQCGQIPRLCCLHRVIGQKNVTCGRDEMTCDVSCVTCDM